MKKRMLGLAVLFALVIGQYVSPMAVSAEEITAGTKQYQTNFTETSLSGGNTYMQQFFQIENYWHVASVDVHLDYKVSQLTQNERSNLTLMINGTPFHSFRPIEQAVGGQQLTVHVPPEMIVKGVNSLTVQGHLETSSPIVQNTCLPTDTRDNWLQIAKTSRIAVNYTTESIQLSIRDFNQHFIGMGTVKEGQNAIAVPKAGNLAELEAATYVVSGYAKANPVTDKAIPLIEYSPDNVKGKQTVILVSLFDDLPEDMKSLVQSNNLENTALIQLIKQADHDILVITSADAGLLVKAGRLAANQTLLSQIDADRKVVDNTTEVDTPTVNVSRTMTLTETGDKLTGDRHQEKAYFISLPGNRSIADASKLRITYRYARNLDFDRSMVTVLINDTPIGSKKLSTELADNDHMDLIIPKTLNISGNFTVKLAFDLELKNTNCLENQGQMPWAFIEKDSMLQLNTKDKADLLFNNYPYPFLRDGSYNKVAVVLPKDKDPYIYQTLTNLFNLLGRYAQTNTGEVLYFQDNVSAQQLKGREIIAIGSYKDNQVIRDQNNKLYFRYDQSGRGFVSNEKMSIDASYGTRMGTLQLLDSPYESGFGLLAVTGSESKYMYLASKLIGSEGTLWKVFGDGVVTDIDGNIHAFRFKKETAAESSNVLTDVLERRDVLGFMTAALLVALLVLLSLIMMIRKYNKKRGDRR
ncbi:cellulose biosynthesis cyclic di-GMP-binding regulatory protein BcsB [Paenibacillus sp. HWE-109]|uniref:cellulose biosynthesis cyclic di-GMP-binding regulatory protein BcsB n=1 Tax=Paenibacillus sp. HWE-109 TaxID=1306526 RepID=UPI001EE147B9|nr:cellulose biosynthesis cyclic di-GMP-binding regulatory protein BcsB [Paenibacillus sp. HWE-109]UKS29734.1 cellulose biosynthesis cyclic di-GMP-binding regulatory protein BcsB [Paenibacillus sp. HWE-109]